MWYRQKVLNYGDTFDNSIFQGKVVTSIPDDLPLPQEILVPCLEVSEELLGPLGESGLLLRDGIGLDVDLVQPVNGVFGVAVVSVAVAVIRDDVLHVDAPPLQSRGQHAELGPPVPEKVESGDPVSHGLIDIGHKVADDGRPVFR